LLQNAQKYAPLTFIFDIGGSFQSLTSIFGGSYLNVGQEARDFTINPFSLPPTKENLQFLFSLFRVLIEGNGQRYRLDFKEERKLWEGIERMYVLEPDQRTVSNFANTNLVASRAPGDPPEVAEGYKRPVEANIDSATGQPYLVYEGIRLDTASATARLITCETV
jgi:type IV secretory pathway VirB4 component